MTAKGAGESDSVNMSDAHFIHQELNARIERGLGQLNLTDIGLGDDDV